ncbi:MAG: hypothetical protein MK208_02740 [Shimia sp.]|jgi:hypothetical protein|uniref:hypothetical protein n=1 Tax=Shimia sp. TaxID=1954381 RepID=UPI0025D71B0B|nr:hypothetical protein [Shimia sp.]MCH2066128.1 hypothetical protein [Shimia sp.]
MNGVVLWHDSKGGTAVIWCEDHANLAYFNAEKDASALGSDVVTLAAGDLVMFDIMMVGHQRRAFNLRRLAPGTPLAEHLLQAAMAVETGEVGRALRAALHLPEAVEDKKTSAKVIDLEAAARSRKVS